MANLNPGHIIRSSVSGKRYRVGVTLGKGGFGETYRATLLSRRSKPLGDFCLKTTEDMASWHREAYFGELLKHSRRVIRVHDSFALAPGRSGRDRMVYCLIMELAEYGTIQDYFAKGNRPWRPARARREIAALLAVLDKLHGGGATHRDITPKNIFVCGNGTLKVGDFGIARHQLTHVQRAASTFDRNFVRTDILEGDQPYWSPADDVYQMGHLLAMLLCGRTRKKVKAAEVDEISCDEGLRAIIKRAIGPRRRSYSDAYEMLRALRGEDKKPLRLRSFKGKRVAFSGPLSIKRFDAELLVVQAGGRVAQELTPSTDVLVLGTRDRRLRRTHKTNTIMTAEQLVKQGHKLRIIGEAEFRQLAHKH